MVAKELPRETDDLTEFLSRWNDGDLSVEPALMAQLYPILRSVARRQLFGVGPITLQATELANEAFIRLRQQGARYVKSQGQFLSFCAHMLRNMVVDHVRGRSTQKRGGQRSHVDIDEARDVSNEAEIVESKEKQAKEIDWLKLDQALVELEGVDPELARLVEYRYFLGYSKEQCAEHFNVSMSTITRKWRFARAFLAEHWQNALPEANETEEL